MIVLAALPGQVSSEVELLPQLIEQEPVQMM